MDQVHGSSREEYTPPDSSASSLKSYYEEKGLSQRQSRLSLTHSIPGLDAKSFVKHLIYKPNDSPRWIFCFITAAQNCLVAVFYMRDVFDASEPYFCAPMLSSYMTLLASCFFITGVINFTQTLVGVRIPTVSGADTPHTLTILHIVNSVIPQEHRLTCSRTRGWSQVLIEKRFLKVLATFQGCVIITGIMEFLIGTLGLTNIILNSLSPLVIGTSLMIVPIMMIRQLISYMKSYLHISLMTIGLMGFFSFIMGNVKIRIPHSSSKSSRWHFKRHYFFQLYSVHLTLAIVLPIWYIVGLEKLPNTLTEKGEVAVTPYDDTAGGLWFRMNSPGEFGAPEFPSFPYVLPLLVSLLANMLTSVGTYYAVAVASGLSTPPVHAMNRGIGINGIGTIFGGLWGSLGSTVGYRTSGGCFTMTMVASRRVGYSVGLILIFLAFSPKLSYYIIHMPKPILAAVMTVLYANTLAQGMGFLKYADMKNRRNQHLAGVVLLLSLGCTEYLESHKDAMKYFHTGLDYADVLIRLIITNPMILSFILALFLDVTVPGSDVERGMVLWKRRTMTAETLDELVHHSAYALPIGMNNVLKNFRFTSRMPFCPVFNVETTLLEVLQVYVQVLCKRESPAAILKRSRDAEGEFKGDSGMMEDFTI